MRIYWCTPVNRPMVMLGPFGTKLYQLFWRVFRFGHVTRDRERFGMLLLPPMPFRVTWWLHKRQERKHPEWWS